LVQSILELYLFCEDLREIVFDTAMEGTARLNRNQHDTYHYLNIA